MPGRVLDNYPAFWELKNWILYKSDWQAWSQSWHRIRSGFAPRQTKNSRMVSPPLRTEKSITENGKNEKEMK